MAIVEARNDDGYPSPICRCWSVLGIHFLHDCSIWASCQFVKPNKQAAEVRISIGNSGGGHTCSIQAVRDSNGEFHETIRDYPMLLKSDVTDWNVVVAKRRGRIRRLRKNEIGIYHLESEQFIFHGSAHRSG